MNFMPFSDNTQDTDTNIFPMIKHFSSKTTPLRLLSQCWNVFQLSIKEHEHMFGYIIFLTKPLTSRFHSTIDNVFLHGHYIHVLSASIIYSYWKQAARKEKYIMSMSNLQKNLSVKEKTLSVIPSLSAISREKRPDWTIIDEWILSGHVWATALSMSIQSRVGCVFQPLSVNVGSIARWMLVNTTDLFLKEWAQRNWSYHWWLCFAREFRRPVGPRGS